MKILKSFFYKLLIFWGISILLSLLAFYVDGTNFFSALKVMGIVIIIIGIAALTKGEPNLPSTGMQSMLDSEMAIQERRRKPYNIDFFSRNIISPSNIGFQIILIGLLLCALCYLLE